MIGPGLRIQVACSFYVGEIVPIKRPHGEMFGNARLDDTFSRLDSDHMICIDALLATADDYLAGQSPFDDCKAIVIDFN